MSNLTFDISVVRGTPKMVESGIMARATVCIKEGTTVLVKLEEMTIRVGDKGPWVAYPARQGTNNEGKTTYYKYYRFAPDNEDMRKRIEDSIIRQYNATPMPTGTPSYQNKTTSRAPVNAAPAANKSNDNESLSSFSFKLD